MPCHEYAEPLLPSPSVSRLWRHVDIILTDGGISHPNRHQCAPTSVVGMCTFYDCIPISDQCCWLGGAAVDIHTMIRVDYPYLTSGFREVLDCRQG